MHQPLGIDIRPADTLLVERARDYLAAGPADVVALIASVCQLPGVPRGAAERMAAELLGDRREFVRAADGRWRLAVQAAPGAPPLLPTFDEWMARRSVERSAGASGAPETSDGAAAPGPGARARVARAPRLSVELPLPPDAPGAGDPLEALSYVVVDTETTGGTPAAGHRITEIAAVVVSGGEVRDVFEALVNPERVIPPQIVKLTGITMDMVRDKPPFREIAADLLGALRGRVFVAHNVGFDWRFITAELQRASGVVVEGRRLCTVRLARRILPQLRSRSLGYVADFYGADEFARTYFEGKHGRTRPWRHSAAGDAVATAHCLLRLLRDARRDHGVATWGELTRFLAGGSAAARRPRRSALPTPVRKDPGA